MARTQYAKVLWFGEWRIIHDTDKKYNQWIVTKKNRKVTDYADYASCLLYLAEVVKKQSEVI